ncbi:MAG: vWA domain-containing protein [Planctomycetota bacterium]
MSFTHPWVLFLLVLPALLLIWVWRRADRRVVLPFDEGVARRGLGLRSVIDVCESVPALLLGVAIVLLAGPRELSAPKTKRVMTNIEFCVDVSGSMTAEFGDGSRYDASMEAINEFLDFREGDAFGLTFFGNSVLHWVPLTSDTSALRCAPPFMRPENLPNWFNGTEIGKALLACQSVLESRSEGDRMIILVSDGYSFDLNNDQDLEISKRLRESNIVVYAIHISETDIPDPIVNVTTLTGGAVFNPGDPGALKAVFKRIDEMQPTRLEKTSAETIDDLGPASLAGLGALAVLLLAALGLRYTPW